jgi:malonate-semialdehyde dehydrogenase (acetylating) / methylmalonate-semialdehyde dehydrogenase
MSAIAHWVDGKPWQGRGARQGPVYDPATGRLAAQVALASVEDVDVAVRSARNAFAGWRSAPLSTRTRVLFAFRELLQKQREELALLITRQHGKVLADARGEVARGQEVVEFACGIPQLLKGSHSESVSERVDVHSLRQPLGVVAAITPFNFPAMVPLWMVPIAVACGNACVLKPSERDPGASLLLARLFAQAGLPDGVLNVVQGDREAVDALLVHPEIDAVSFVGSTPVARHVYATAAAKGKRVQALGGAKNHMIVMPDADLEAAADAAVGAAYGSAGERCMAISVVVAVEPTGDALVARLAERVRGLRVGDGALPGVEMGPLVTREHRDRVARSVAHGVAEGAELVVDGRGLRVDACPDGFFLGPCLFDRVLPSMEIYRDEIFGPVLCVARCASPDEAQALVNANPHGNGVAVFTRDGAVARRFERELRVGMVGINVAIPVPVAYYSFGGWGDSLFGDTHVYGPDAVHFYTRGKVVTSRWSEPRRGSPDLGFPGAG